MTIKSSHCDYCDRTTNHDVISELKTSWDDDSSDVSGGAEHFFLRCRGCDHVSYRRESWFSEETDFDGSPVVKIEIFPKSLAARQQPAWFGDLVWRFKHRPLCAMMEQVYGAYDREQYWIAIIGVRAAIETLMLSKIQDQGSFAKNLAQFTSEGFVTDAHRLALGAAIDKGSAAIHKALMPTADVALAAIQVAENVIEAVLVVPEREAQLKGS